ncbi:hypothetical protein KVR01_011770 [Diaporthe batatas]|uniref:uncharacterized protein n=1 Tax=Diaporthe batatas TaxID=748121 RepID=UPI001D057771|nr:uncharacterized protein KVR01_011770 [Diaporthe batatas]KAG8158648.1 hypothetical protein KVR01_011770 [Diaporthe batatas]
MERLRRKTLPAWPDPTDSLGQKVNTRTRRIGGSSVWFPRGPALERYNATIRPEVERILNNVELPEGEKMILKMYMIGRSEQRANPVVMICCPDKATRKRAEAMVRESDLFERQESCGFGLGSAGFPLEATFLPRPLGNGIYLNADATMEAALKVDVYGLTGPGIGRKLGFVTSSQSTRSVQYATGGPVVQLGDKLYQLTVAHAAQPSHRGPKDPQEQYSDLDECDFDGQSDEEEDEHMILSRGSISPGWPMRDADIDSDQTRSQQSSAYSDSYAETPDTPHFHSPTMMLSPKSVEVAEEHDDWKSSTLLGSFPMPDGYGGELDYLLVHLPGDYSVPSKDPNQVVIARFGPRSVQLLTVVLSEGLREGDSGSALIDARTGDFYGYVILGTDGDCVAYALPSPMIMAKITTQFQHLPSFHHPMENPPRQRRAASSGSSMPSILEDMTWSGNQKVPLNDHMVALQRNLSYAEVEVERLNEELRSMRSELEVSREVSLDPALARDIQAAMADQGFQEQLRSLEQWFCVVSAGQQRVALHTLLQNANPAHVDSVRHVLRRWGPVVPLSELFGTDVIVPDKDRPFPEQQG